MRVVGFLLAATTFALLVIDGTRSIAANILVFTPIAETATKIGPELFRNLHVWLERPDHSRVIVESLQLLLALPTFLVIGILASLLLLMSRRPQPKIGYFER
jgi:hypothetical protein